MINLNLETTNPEKLTTQAITEEVSNLWEKLIKLKICLKMKVLNWLHLNTNLN